MTFPWAARVLFAAMLLATRVYGDSLSHVLLLGDSIAGGEGDGSLRSGIPGRLVDLFPGIRVTAVSYPGATSARLLDWLDGTLDPAAIEQLRSAIGPVDHIIVIAGTNDFWYGGLPNRSVDRKWRLAALARKVFAGPTPWRLPAVSVASTPPVARELQQNWIEQSNRVLLNVRLFPVVQLHLLSPALIGADETHPDSRGYDELARIAAAHLVQLTPPGEAYCPSAMGAIAPGGVRMLTQSLQFESLLPWGERPQAAGIRETRRKAKQRQVNS